MITLYAKCEQSSRLLAQARKTFGMGSPEATDAQSIADYWRNQWMREGSPLWCPPKEILWDKIKNAQRDIRRHEKRRASNVL